MANNKEKPLLDLSTEKFITYVKIDNTTYGLLYSDELGLTEQGELSGLGRELVKVSKKVDSIETEKKYNKVMASILLIIMPDATRNLIDKLGIVKKYQIIDLYNTEIEALKKKTSQLTKGPRAKKKAR
jgi:hypothetical protein